LLFSSTAVLISLRSWSVDGVMMWTNRFVSLEYPLSVDRIGGATLILRVFSPAINNYIDFEIVTRTHPFTPDLTAIGFTRSIAPEFDLKTASDLELCPPSSHTGVPLA
ncbi:hypothetical protein, partial [Chamaesiphon sp. OTE_20_metabat_361]|uniref:hypothetical protein n=1 Tax=Chamaesiphon sp. OTE_20_metabat_361 TaxID=2964689 RepID=UPI00286AF64B